MTTETETTAKTVKPPVAKIRVGLVTASIWERAAANSVYHGVTFERSYRDANGQWHTTQSYDGVDLLALAKASDLAHTRILEIRAAMPTPASE